MATKSTGKKLMVACSPLTRTIYAGRATLADVNDPLGPHKWQTKQDVTQDAVKAVAQYLGQPGAYVELNTTGSQKMMLALLSQNDFALLEAARLGQAKEKAADNGE